MFGVRRSPGVLAAQRIGRLAVAAVAGQDARDERAVAVGVVGVLGLGVDDDAGDDARARVGLRDAEVRQVARDARVDDRDADALAGGVLPEVGGPSRAVVDRGHLLGIEVDDRARLGRGVDRHRLDGAVLRQGHGLGVRQLGADGVDEPHVAGDCTAGPLHRGAPCIGPEVAVELHDVLRLGRAGDRRRRREAERGVGERRHRERRDGRHAAPGAPDRARGLEPACRRFPAVARREHVCPPP